MARTKHLFLISNYPPDGQWSMRLYADLVQRVAEEDGWEVQRLAPRNRCAGEKETSNGFGKLLGYVDKYVFAYFDFRRALNEARVRGETPDIVHIADHSNAMYTGVFSGIPVIVTCHDVIAIRRALGEFTVGRPGFTGRLQQRWILDSLRKVRHFLFDSDASRRDLARLVKRNLDGEPIVFPCLGQKLSPIEPERARQLLLGANLRLPPVFLLHHGNASWYKNREQVLETFLQVSLRRPEVHLVCSGGDLTGEQRMWIQAKGIANKVHETGGVSAEVLEALYSQAAVFFFPSWVEGFGWPPVEAQACGCPVVASNAGSLAEILGDSALLAAPDDGPTFCRHILAILENEGLAADLRRKGSENVTRFAIGTMAENLRHVYEAAAIEGNR